MPPVSLMIARRPGEGTGRFPKAGPVPSAPTVQGSRASGRAGELRVRQAVAAAERLAQLRSAVHLRGPAREPRTAPHSVARSAEGRRGSGGGSRTPPSKKKKQGRKQGTRVPQWRMLDGNLSAMGPGRVLVSPPGGGNARRGPPPPPAASSL